MRELEWWAKLDPDTKAWLTDHNGEAVSSDVLLKIVAAGGTPDPASWWVSETGADGFFLSDAAIDWIEAAANDESD